MIKAKPYHMTTVKLEPDMYILAKKYGIRVSDAVRAGISLLLAERGVSEYNNKLNIMRRINKLQQLLNEKSQELEKLKIDSQE